MRLGHIEAVFHRKGLHDRFDILGEVEGREGGDRSTQAVAAEGDLQRRGVHVAAVDVIVIIILSRGGRPAVVLTLQRVNAVGLVVVVVVIPIVGGMTGGRVRREERGERVLHVERRGEQRLEPAQGLPGMIPGEGVLARRGVVPAGAVRHIQTVLEDNSENKVICK